jgi:hypothetical protein
MFRSTVIFFGVILLESVLEEILFVRMLRMPEPPAVSNLVVGLAAAIVCGAFGNQWYLSHARKVIADVRSQGLTEDEHLRVLARRGGTSVLASIGFFVLFVVVASTVLLTLRWLFSQA